MDILSIDVKKTGLGSLIVNIIELDNLSKYSKEEKAIIKKDIIDELEITFKQ